MPTAAEFSIARGLLVQARDELTESRASIDSIVETGVRGGTVEGLIDDGFVATKANMDGLMLSIESAIELCEFRRSVCEEFADRYAAWEIQRNEFEFLQRTQGPNVQMRLRAEPKAPYGWVQR